MVFVASMGLHLEMFGEPVYVLCRCHWANRPLTKLTAPSLSRVNNLRSDGVGGVSFLVRVAENNGENLAASGGKRVFLSAAIFA